MYFWQIDNTLYSKILTFISLDCQFSNCYLTKNISLFGTGQTNKFDAIIFGLPQQMSDQVKYLFKIYFQNILIKQNAYTFRKQKNITTGKEIQTKDTFSDKWNLLWNYGDIISIKKFFQGKPLWIF